MPHYCMCIWLYPKLILANSTEAYQYKEVSWQRHSVLPWKNCLHVPGHQPIKHRVKQQQGQHLSHGEVIIHRHRVKQV